MQSLPIKLLALALVGSSSITAHALGQGKQAQIRVSMVIVDSCDVELVRPWSGGAGQEARVSCSSFMPHQLIVAPDSTAIARSAPPAQDAVAPAQPQASRLAALSPFDADVPPPLAPVTVATIVF